MNITLKMPKNRRKELHKTEDITCGKLTCRSKNTECRFLGRWLLPKGAESPYCCELLKIHGIMPHPLNCFRHWPYRICGIFEIKQQKQKRTKWSSQLTQI